MKKLSLVVVLLAVFGFCAVAEEIQKNSDADYQVVYQLFEVMKMEEQMKNTTDKMLDVQIRSVPMIAAYKEELAAFMDKYVSYKALKKDIADLYLKHFSVADLQELMKFYQTPIGQKLLFATPALMNDTIDLTQRKTTENQAELQKMIAEKMQKLNQNQNQN